MRILIADDQKSVVEILARMVVSCHHELVGIVTSGGLDVIAAYDRLRPEVVILDIHMPRINGLTVCHVLMSRVPAPKVIFFSGNYDASHPFIRRSGARAYLAKPATVGQLESVLRSLEDSVKIAEPIAAAA